MAFSIEPHLGFFLYSINGNENPSFNSTSTAKKTSAAADKVLKESSKWYVKVPHIKPPVTKRLSPNMVDIVSKTLLQTNKKPIPPPRSDKTRLSPTPEYSKIDNQKKALGSDLLSAVVNAKNALKPSEKIPPKPLPRSPKTHLSSQSEHSNTEKAPAKNTPLIQEKSKTESIFVPIPTVPTSPPKRRVSFQIKEAKDLKTNESATPNTCPAKSILKKTSSFNNTDIESKKVLPKEELTGWADVDKILNECFEYLNNHIPS